MSISSPLPISDTSWASRLLRPRSIAVIGASQRPGSLPSQAMANLRRFGFTGDIHQINPRYTMLHELPCHPSVLDLPEAPDIALVLVPAEAATAAVRECAEVGVGAAVVFSSGFAELGAAGRVLQDDMVTSARSSGMRLLGPNCQGVIYRPGNLVATFSEAAETSLGDPSGVAYVGQSGALGGSFLGMARQRGIGITAWASTGNQADLNVVEMATGLLEEDGVRIIAAYLEAIPDGAEWQDLAARAADLGKDIVVLRSGRSAAGRRAAESHTGAMIGPDVAFELESARFGVIGVRDLDEMLDTVVELVPGKRMTGSRAAVVTSSGGAGGLAADQLEAVGLGLSELDEATRFALRRHIPEFGSTTNPVDVTAQLFAQTGGALSQVCSGVLADPDTNALILVLTNVTGKRAADIARQVVEVAAVAPTPLGVVWLADAAQIAEAVGILREHDVPVHFSIHSKTAALARVHRSHVARLSCTPAGARVAIRPELEAVVDALAMEGPLLSESRGTILLDILGIARPPSSVATSADEAAQAALGFGTPTVLKIQSAAITHKTEAGGVRMVDDPADAAATFTGIVAAARERRPDAVVEGVLVQQRAAGGVELLVGVDGAKDGYPPVLTVGIGGIYAELYSDTRSALAPVTPDAAHELLLGLRGAPLLAGYRQQPGVDISAAAQVISSLSHAAAQLGSRLDELEINPLIVHHQGATAVDLIVRLVAEPEA